MSLLKCCFHDVFDNYLSFFAAQNYKIIEDAVVKSVNKTKNNVFLILGMLRILPDIDKSILVKKRLFNYYKRGPAKSIFRHTFPEEGIRIREVQVT